jgi:hypothetical protein
MKKMILLLARDTPNGLYRNQYPQVKLCGTDPTHLALDMRWYAEWLSQQREKIPHGLLYLRVGQYKLQERQQSLRVLFEAIDGYTCGIEGVSIDEITAHLRQTGVFDSTADQKDHQTLLVFAALGWTSMLYQADLDFCLADELIIHCDSDQPQSGLVFDTFKIPFELSDRPLSVLLKAFGHLLPARSSNSPYLAGKTSSMASVWQPLHPEETNAYLLHVLLRVHIRWVDVLALHLDYDKTTRTLSLFRYPSFCVAMIRGRGSIYSFSSIEDASADPRAKEEDIEQFLREVLLSYRLLFAQSARSRKLFRQFYTTSDFHSQPIDPLLFPLCTQKRIGHCSVILPTDRPLYLAARDFPVLYDRIELIANDLKDARPSTIVGLIKDRRNVLQYWTFWLVAIFGGISIVLSFIQVMLQALSMT